MDSGSRAFGGLKCTRIAIPGTPTEIKTGNQETDIFGLKNLTLRGPLLEPFRWALGVYVIPPVARLQSGKRNKCPQTPI